jgi:Protein of unknown function (DUF3800)
MHLVYIDDSGDEQTSIFSALLIPVEEWSACFQRIKDFRRALRASDGIYVHKELHATDLIGGRGRIADVPISKPRRARIFMEAVKVVSNLPGVKLMNACFPANEDELALERLLNRIQVNMERSNSHAIIICDEGKEDGYTRLRRKMAIHNPIPSRLGAWPTGAYTRNIPIDRIVEDLVFKKSDKSYLIQMADLCAYALLRSERPLASKTALGIDRAFDHLEPICVTLANQNDPRRLGIIRP